MSSFHSARQATEFLITKIVDEAQRENIGLSEVERKMLDFSETSAVRPDMAAVSDEFDRVYNQDQYENKIAGLIKKAYKQVRRGPGAEYDIWWSAIGILKDKDHYISVLIDKADLRRRGDSAKLLGAGIVIVAMGVGVVFAFDKYAAPFNKYEHGFYIFLWMAAVVSVGAYTLLRMILGNKRVDDFTDRMVGIILGEGRVK